MKGPNGQEHALVEIVSTNEEKTEKESGEVDSADSDEGEIDIKDLYEQEDAPEEPASEQVGKDSEIVDQGEEEA